MTMEHTISTMQLLFFNATVFFAVVGSVAWRSLSGDPGIVFGVTKICTPLI